MIFNIKIKSRAQSNKRLLFFIIPHSSRMRKDCHFLQSLKGEGGQSLVDILVALGILSLGISLTTILVFGGQDALIDKSNTDEARSLAEEGLRGAELIVKSSWEAVNDGNYGLAFATGSWIFVGNQDQTGFYTREINIRTIDTNTKEIKSTITWSTDPDRPQKVELITLATNWATVIATGGDACGGSLTGDWANPRTLGSVDIGAGNSATGLDVKDKIVYLTGTASDSKKPDFFVVDATNGASPRLVSSLHTGSSLNAVDVAGNYAYVANRSATAQLQIIDISNISSSTLIKSFRLPGVSASANVVFYLDGKVYMGTNAASGPEFHIVNVANPNQPVSLGSLEINSNINAIYVSADKKAYLALAADDEIRIIDVNTPTAPRVIGSYFAPGNSEDGKALYLVGNRMYLGRTLGSNHTDHHELHILDVSSSSKVISFGSVNFLTTINSLAVQDYLLFMGTSDSNREFQLWNISNPANPTLVSYFNFPQVASSVDCEGNFVYIAVRSNDALRIVTSSP